MDTTAVPVASNEQSTADVIMRRLLFIGDRSATRRSAERIFSASIALSGLRCLFTYILVPILSPLLGSAYGVGPAIGIPLGVLALVFDVRGIRRFFASNHRLRWPITFLYLAVIGLVLSLLVSDVSRLS